MARQYTFKTTVDTTWLDPILEEMTSKQRSAYIRDALVAYVSQRNTRSHTKVTPEVSQPLYRSTDPRYPNGDIEDEPEIATEEVSIDDLESKLDSLDFG